MNELQLKTQSHYNEYPFIEGGSKRISWWCNYMQEFLPDELIRDKNIADIGSGIGEISRGLLNRNAKMTCVDISQTSLERCGQINKGAEFYLASSLELPFADATFDHAISIGVLHHTPDCRKGFKEVARITAPGGTVVIFLYNYWSIYNVIYNTIHPITKIVPLHMIPSIFLQLLQPFAVLHLKESLNTEQLRRLLGDKLWTPRATFHSLRQMIQWGKDEGLEMVKWKRFFLGYANVVAYKKKGDSPEKKLTPQVICLKCRGKCTIKKDGYHCTNCNAVYQKTNGIYKCITQN